MKWNGERKRIFSEKTIKGYKGVEGVRGKDGSWGERELRRGQGNE